MIFVAVLLLIIILIICFMANLYFLVFSLLFIWSLVMGFIAYLFIREKVEEYRRNKKTNK